MCAGAAEVAAEFQPVKAGHGGLIPKIGQAIAHMRQIIEDRLTQSGIFGGRQHFAHAACLRRAAFVKKAVFCETKPSEA